ncbi:diacylglycerol kinase, partial [Klebsiella pneumoniae]
ALLIGAVLMLIMVEVLNTGIEATCDAISREFNIDIQLAKDCGSLAVLISIVLAGGIWLFAIFERIYGIPV